MIGYLMLCSVALMWSATDEQNRGTRVGETRDVVKFVSLVKVCISTVFDYKQKTILLILNSRVYDVIIGFLRSN